MYMEQLMIDIINYYCINQKNSLIHSQNLPCLNGSHHSLGAGEQPHMHCNQAPEHNCSGSEEPEKDGIV